MKPKKQTPSILHVWKEQSNHALEFGSDSVIAADVDLGSIDGLALGPGNSAHPLPAKTLESSMENIPALGPSACEQQLARVMRFQGTAGLWLVPGRPAFANNSSAWSVP